MDYSVDFFTNELSLKLENFKTFFKTQGKKVNSQLAGAYMETFIRNFIQEHVVPQKIVHGTRAKQKSTNKSSLLVAICLPLKQKSGSWIILQLL